jgi:hypothetical protein
MTTRATLAVLALLATSFVGGCYCSHQREPEPPPPPPPPIPFDAFVPDSALPPPSCRIECEPAELIGATAPMETTWSSTLVSVLIVDGQPFVLANVRVDGEDAGENETAYVPYRLEPGSTELLAPTAPMAPRTHAQLSAAGLRDVDGVLRVVGLESGPHVRDDEIDVRAGLATFSRAGDVLSEFEPLATAPFGMRPSSTRGGAVFGRGDRDVAAFVYGAAVHAWDIRRDATTEPVLVDLVTLPSAPEPAPVSGVLLEDGRVVIVGGGTSRPPVYGTVVRPAFLAIGSFADAPLTTRSVVGLRTDPTPQVVPESPGFALVRYAGEMRDLARSSIHVIHADPEGETVSESRLRTGRGLSPYDVFAFAADEHAGVAWSERAPESSAELDVRVLSSGLDDGCETIDADPVLRLTAVPQAMVAAGDDDGATYVAVFIVRCPEAPASCPFAPRIELYRIPRCEVVH